MNILRIYKGNVAPLTLELNAGDRVELDDAVLLEVAADARPAETYHSEVYVAGERGNDPGHDDDPNEPLPTSWPGAPASTDEWNGWTAAQKGEAIERQLNALRQFQFDHNLFTDRILIDGQPGEGFQAMAGATFDRRFTTSADGIVGKLGLEAGQPTTVAHAASAPPPPAEQDQTEREPATHEFAVPWQAVWSDDTRGVYGKDTLRYHFDVPNGPPRSIAFSGVDFPAGATAHAWRLLRNGIVVADGGPLAGVSIEARFQELAPDSYVFEVENQAESWREANVRMDVRTDV